MEDFKHLRKYLGYKFYKEDGDIVKLLRVVRVSEYNASKVTVIDSDTNVKSNISVDDLKEYTPLEPFGFVSFSAVHIDGDYKDKPARDVFITLYRLLDLKMQRNEPYCICRQSVNDFFYNMLSKTPIHDIVGVSVTRDNCPPNIPYETLAMCSGVDCFDMVAFYMDDVIDTVLECINQKPYNEIMLSNFNAHIRASNNFNMGLNKSDNGWCKDIQTLMITNNFIADMDELRAITSIDADLKQYLDEDKDGIQHLNTEMQAFFDITYDLITSNTVVLEYGYDIDMADFNNINYTFWRDVTNTLYIISYLIGDEKREVQLQRDEYEKNNDARIHLSLYDKYHTNISHKEVAKQS